MSRSVRKILLVGLVLTLSAGCTPGATSADGLVPSAQPAEPVVVARRSIVSVLALDVVVQASPEFAVPSTTDGRVVMGTALREGTRLAAGDLVATVAGEPVRTPVDAVFVRWLVYPGMAVRAGIPVAVLRYGGFGVAGTVPIVSAYRVYAGPTSARVQLKGGPGPIGCTPVHPALEAQVPGADEEPSGLPVLCLIEDDHAVTAGLPGLLGLTTGEREDVLALPNTAVAGEAGRGSVAKLVNGEPVVTEVELGITDGVYVEIVSGLEEGDEVLPYGPGLRVPVR